MKISLIRYCKSPFVVKRIYTSLVQRLAAARRQLHDHSRHSMCVWGSLHACRQVTWSRETEAIIIYRHKRRDAGTMSRGLRFAAWNESNAGGRCHGRGWVVTNFDQRIIVQAFSARVFLEKNPPIDLTWLRHVEAKETKNEDNVLCIWRQSAVDIREVGKQRSLQFLRHLVARSYRHCSPSDTWDCRRILGEDVEMEE